MKSRSFPKNREASGFLYLENPRFDRGFSSLIGMSLQRNEKALL